MIGKWFEVKVALKRTLEDGFQKQVKELYLVDALNFTEAESRTLDELKVYGEISIVGIKRSDANELVDSHNPEDGFWYKTKLSLLSIDESKGKEKKVNVNLYVRAKNFKEALANTEAHMSGSVMDYTVTSITETAIMDVFEYKAASDEQ
jgi:hypothetical protein